MLWKAAHVCKVAGEGLQASTAVLGITTSSLFRCRCGWVFDIRCGLTLRMIAMADEREEAQTWVQSKSSAAQVCARATAHVPVLCAACLHFQ